MKEEVLQVWPDGHKLSKDKWQYIVKHPYACKNARLDGGTYSKETYFGDAPAPKSMPNSLQKELKACHLRSTVATS